MIPELQQLLSLQTLDLEIRALESRLSQIPKEAAALKKEIATEKANLKQAQDALAQCLKDRRAREGELEVFEEKLSKFKGQLMLVKTNDEYKAMQKQIENFETERRAKEDEILESMETAEKLQAEIKLREKELKEGETRIRAEEEKLEKEATSLRSERDQRKSAREILLAEIAPERFSEYQRVAKLKGGIVLAEAKDEFCLICHVRLRPQVYNEIRQEKEILKCDSCGRFLYYVGPPLPAPPPAVEPSGNGVSAGDANRGE